MKRLTPTPESGTPTVSPDLFRIEIDPVGPYRLYGHPFVRRYTITNDSEGHSWDYDIGTINYCAESGVTALCRCGQSKNAPYCDGSHVKATERGEWDSELTASTLAPLAGAQEYVGGTLILTDVEELCAFARFCDAKGRTWNQVEKSEKPEQRELAIRTSMACPAGRLKVWDRETSEPFEPNYEPEIGLIEDPTIGVSGPIFVKGGIPFYAPDGEGFQPRNRVTLCRCGQSRNKPFCDGTHSPAKYRDGILEDSD